MKNIRPFGWVIIFLNLYFFFSFFRNYDPNGSDTANGLGFMLLIFWLAIMNTFLYVLYRITGGRRRDCPACGVGVKKGLTVCPSCNFDFMHAAGGDKSEEPNTIIGKQEGALSKKFISLHPLVQIPIILIGGWIILFVVSWILAPYSQSADDINCGVRVIFHLPCSARFNG